jgi:hypothetical protein
VPYIFRSPVWPDPRVKPPFGTGRLAPGHSLAANLCAAYLFNEGAGVRIHDAFGPNHCVASSSAAATWRATNNGLVLSNSGSGSIHRASAAGLPTDYPFAIHAITQCNSGANGTHRHTGAYLGGGSARYAIGWSGTDTATPTINYGAFGNGTNQTLNRRYAMTGIFHSATDRKLYINGQQVLTSTTNIAFSALDATAIFSNPGTAFVDTEYVLFYRHSLTLDQMAWLVAEPYGMFEPILQRRWFIPSEAGTEFTPTGGSTALAGIAANRIVGTILTPFTP